MTVSCQTRTSRLSTPLLRWSSLISKMRAETPGPEPFGLRRKHRERTMKLYYLAGSCALAPHIALELSGLPYEAIRVERGKQTDPSYLAINPLARVPALVTPDHDTITEVPAVLCFIAEMAPDRRLLPDVGTRER